MRHQVNNGSRNNSIHVSHECHVDASMSNQLASSISLSLSCLLVYSDKTDSTPYNSRKDILDHCSQV